jgi:Uma2 family endonuclease
MEIDWEIANDTVVKPDVLIICHNIEEKVIRTPFVIFEVSSPSTAKRDEMLKFELYQKEAVDYYILIYSDKKIAKVFFWVNGYYQKQGDFSGEYFEFKLLKKEAYSAIFHLLQCV